MDGTEGRYLVTGCQSQKVRLSSDRSLQLDFHGLTGGVYKARERIHRVIADTRLLVIPASRSRVADSDPN